MDMTSYSYFPRLHTAIAEWLSCMMVLLPMRRRFSLPVSCLLAVLCLGSLICINLPAEGSTGLMYFALTILALINMYLMILLLGKRSACVYIHGWAFAFLFSEMAASLEWQISAWLVRLGVFTARWQIHLFMLGMFTLLFGAGFLLTKRHVLQDREHVLRATITFRQAIAAVSISIGAFLISNVTFAFPVTTLLGTINESTLHVRTVVDIGGLCMLYAFDVQRRELDILKELHATESILCRQYEQYQQFEANNEVLHRIYHDLKHQIAYLEDERDANKRRQALSEMKETLLRHEARISTGNTVLDTLLTSKSLICLDEGITMTCYANAEGIGFISTMDLCAILGNALDNAIEYARTVSEMDSRLIRVFVSREGSFVVIRIENYCDRILKFRNGLPDTTKADKEHHGYGLRSIRISVEKYNGALEVKQEDDWFILVAMIPVTDKGA